MADNKFINNNGQMERKIDLSKQFYREGKDIYDASTQRRITLPEWEQSWTGRAQEVSAPIGRTEALLPKGNVQTAAMPQQQQTSPIDNFNLLLTNMLSKAQGVSTTDLLKRRRDLQRAAIGRTEEITPEALRTLSPAQQEAIRSGKTEALRPDIDKNAYDIAKAEEATKNFEFIFNQTRQLGEEFQKKMVAPDNVIDSYVKLIEADPSNFNNIASKLNEKTFQAVIAKLDYSKLDTSAKKQEAELEMYKQKKMIDAQYTTPTQDWQIVETENGVLKINKKTGEVEYVSASGADVSSASAEEIASAIKQKESGGNYQAQGASGENGSYQFMPSTWLGWSQEYLQSQGKAAQSLPMTPENQDAVAIFKIKQLQAQGYTPEQIASIWNSGNPDPYAKGVKGVGKNSQGVAYNVPGYVDSFKNILSGIVGKGGEISPLAQSVLDGTTNINSLPASQAGKIRNEIANAGKVVPTLDKETSARVDKIVNQFDNEAIVKSYNTIAEGYSFATSLSNTSTSSADDIGLIYAFAKAMDPNSVVREGEYSTVQKYAQSWKDNFGFNAQRVVDNIEFLSTQARSNLKSTIQKKYEASERQYNNLYSEYVRRVNNLTKQDDGEAYITDYKKGNIINSLDKITPSQADNDFADNFLNSLNQ